MYISLGSRPSQAWEDPPQDRATNPSATFAVHGLGSDGQSVAQLITSAIRLMPDAIIHLRTQAQQELLRVVINILQMAFPRGFGLINQSGQMTRIAVRARIRTNVRYGHEIISRPFEFYVDLYLSNEPSDRAAGRHMGVGSSGSQIRLYARHFRGRQPSEIAGLLVHEMIHVMAHLHRSAMERVGEQAAAVIPTRAAAGLLDLRGFVQQRRVMEQQLSRLINVLNRQPHRRVLFPFESDAASRWARLLLEEVLAYIYRDRLTSAIATVEAHRTAGRTGRGVAIGTSLVPMEFLRGYLRYHWLGQPEDVAALDRPEAHRIVGGMETDLSSLVRVIESHVGP